MKKQKKEIKLEGTALLIQKEFLDLRKEINRRFDEIHKYLDVRLNGIEGRLGRMEAGYENVRVEVREIKYLLQQKASVEELNELDMRLTKVETKLRKAGVL